MKKYFFLLSLIWMFSASAVGAQEFIRIWKPGCMANSRGLSVKDSMNAELICRVSVPGMYAFRPSNAENKGAAVLILPSGGYSVLSYATGFQLAKWFNTIGVTAFVLKYRLPQSPDVIDSYKAPLQDAQRAMRWIRSKSKEWGYDATKVGVMGASAGGHIAACLSTITNEWYLPNDSIDYNSFIPAFAILISPVISMLEAAHVPSRNTLLGKKATPALLEQFSCQLHVGIQTPPSFIALAEDDQTVSPVNSLLYFSSLLKQDVKGCSLHIFPNGGHSIRVRKNPGITGYWPVLAENWLIETGIIN
ncbi:MAG: alpha/beta hydrolase [Bacteroidota bacterium]|nr:alpha/beta hydrolase [Bacteroidota bacterium]MDP4268498.1 alpha/beta hydrolase [Bacteroidota bacterium]